MSTSIRSTNSDSSDDHYSSDEDEDDNSDPDPDSDSDPLDRLNQDEDVIRVAEEAQEEDLDEAAQSAELEVMLTDSERKAASTALSKVSIVIYLRASVFTDHTL